eukprot:11828227-Karenia_brevis.AAC.1
MHRLPKRRKLQPAADGLAEELLYGVGLGKIPPTFAQELAQAATKSHDKGNLHPDQKAVEIIASWGNSGNSSQNIERDLFRATKGLYGLKLETYDIWLDLCTTDDAKTLPTRCPVLLPHEIVLAIQRAGPWQIEASIYGGQGKQGVLEFWKHCLQCTDWA